MIDLDIVGKIKHKKEIKDFVFDSLMYLIPELDRDVCIDIKFSNVLEHYALGYCSGDTTNVEIEIAKTNSNGKLTIDEMMLTLAHELIHAKQFIKGELTSNNTWKNTSLLHLENSTRPWEKQAYLFEDLIFNTFWLSNYK